MEIKNYPCLTCSDCAVSHGGKWPNDLVDAFSMGICDVCNEWKAVIDPQNYQYPSFTKNRDLHKIYTQLMRAMFNFIQKKDYFSALDINYQIDEIIHEIYEMELEHGRTASSFSRKQRRSFGERSQISQRAV